MIYYKNSELYHHGILGQKWGVRRYQNYDGSLTQRGLKRYREAKSEYEYQDQRYKSLKKKAKETKENKDIIAAKNAKVARKKAEKAMNNKYKKLKQDKLADQGKDLYAQGYTIGTGKRAVKTAGLISAILGATVTATNINAYVGPGSNWIKEHSLELGIASAAIGAAAIAGDAYTKVQDRKMRAYYNHS